MGHATSAHRRWEGRAVLHVDLDAFFAAVEQLDHPEWRGKPVIVGGDPDKRGVVSTASYEARIFGVHSAMPSARAVRLCPQAIWAHPRFDRYKELSDAVFAIFRDETPHVQPLSIDEAFLDVTPGTYSAEHPVDVALRIQSRVAELGITCAAGLSSSKTVSKIASDFHKPAGLTVVQPGEEAEFLAPLPVRAMSGIGPKSAERLERLGILTLGQLAALDDETALRLMGRHGLIAVQRARGLDTREVHDREPVKSVSNERTFATDVRNVEEVDAAVSALAARVGQRLRRKGLSGRTVSVKLRFSDFSTHTLQRTLLCPTDDETQFGPIARELIHQAWVPGIGIRLLGVGMSAFEEREVQPGLFDSATATADSVPQMPMGATARAPGARRQDRVVRSLDAVRERFGDSAITRGIRPVAADTGTPSANPSDLSDDAESSELG